ncbi:MAG: endonuclease MutS2, partial [Candidatus Latescibacteria bacterium]|nr:endonuclease MutS2 [Candidatus Latescibacterota bacterium]
IRVILEKCRPVGAVVLPAEMRIVRETLAAIEAIKRYYERRRERYPSLFTLTARLRVYTDVEEAIDRAVDEAGEIKDSATRELARIRRGMVTARDMLRSKISRILDRLPDEVLQDRVITIREGRFVVPVREGSRRKVEGIIHDQSDTGATVFLEPLATVEDGNRLRQLELTEKREVERILRELTGIIGGVADSLSRDMESLGQFDCTYAAASFALDFRMVAPVLREDGVIRIKGGRHPILETRFRRDDPETHPVPLDIELGRDFSVLVITGPNAGGKTVALKTVGLLTLMTQAGLPIPAHEASEIGIFRAVFADIGDEQSIENDLSTFSSHVRRLAEIVKIADAETLVLLDEIGGSTSPTEGAALAMAALEYLAERGAKVIVTTHHGTLKSFAHDYPAAHNASMEFDAVTLKPTFRLKVGIPGSSYAFEIADRIGLAQEVVTRAATYAGEETRKLETLIADLEQRVKHATTASVEAERLKEGLERMRVEYEERLRGITEDARRVHQEALSEADRILRNANALIEQTVAEIRTRQAASEVIKGAKAAVDGAKREIKERLESVVREEKTTPETRMLHQGDRVWAARFNNEGVVLGERGSSGKFLVRIGNAEVEIAAGELRLLEPKPVQERPLGLISSPREDVLPSISIRGMRLDEAIEVVDKYLDDAFLAHLETVTIIHGKGTGVLRTKIGEFLRTHPRVKSQRLGAWNEGGSGVTIVHLSDE